MQVSQKARRGNQSVRSNPGITAAAQDILSKAVNPLFEQLERRQLMSTVYVNDNWVVTNDPDSNGLSAGDTVADSDASDNNLVSGKTFGTDAFDSIAAGIAAAGVGGTVHVSAGQYSVPTTITNSVTLLGDNTNVSPTSGSPRTLKESILNASAGSLSVTGGTVTVDGFTIRDASTSGGAGVNVSSATSITIGHNIITANSVGVVINTGVSDFTVSDNLISSNNRAGANRGQGVRALANGGTGTIIRNRFSGHTLGTTPGAVSLNGSSGVSIGNATDGNQFDGNAVAIRISGAASSNVIRNNNMNPPNTTDIIVESTGANAISTLSGNTFGAATTYINYAGSSELNAASNTFGGVNPNGNLVLAQQYAIEDKIVDGIDAAGRGMVLIDPGHVYVTQLSESTNAGAIGRASTLSHSGDTLRISAGNFVDQITINHALSVIGAGNTTVIKPIASLATLFTTSDVNKPIIYATGANSVNISQLKVDGNGQGNGNYRFMGIAYNDAGGTIDHVTITSIRENPLGGSQHGVSLLVNDTLTARAVTISNNTITDYQKSGIFVAGASLTATVTGNTVTGVGNTVQIAQNGITLTNGATGSITNNTVSGNMYSGGAGGMDPATSTQSCGILVLNGSGTISITGNILDGNDIGIYNFGNATISGNTLGATAGNRYEGIFLDQGSTTVSGNTIDGSNMGIAVYSFDLNTADSTAVITNNTVTNAGVSVQVFDDQFADAFKAKADISGNSLAGTGGVGTGVDVSNGGVARIQNNNLSNHLVGIKTSFNANVDAGSQAGDLHPTGFGLSAGNNDLTGYSGTAGSFAIDNENTTPDVTVYARNNNFGPTMTNAIVEQRIIDDSDPGTRTQVIFTPFQNAATPPTDVWVDDDWSSTIAGTDADGAGSNGTSFGYDQFANIQDAIDAVTAGGNVFVAAGSYTQNLVVNKNLQLRGALAGSDARTRSTTLAANESIIIPANAGNPSLTFQTGSGGSGSLLTGFAFSGGSVQLSGASGPIDNMLISGNLFVGFTGSAISMSTGGNNLQFSTNKMDGTSMTGTAPIMSLGSSAFGGLIILNNAILNGGANHTGLSVDGNHTVIPSVGPGARNPQIMGNTVSFNKDGIDLGSQSFQFGTIALNVIANNTRDGLVGGPQDSTIRQNTFDSNGRYGMNLNGGLTPSASQGAQRDTIINNFFKVSGSSDLFLDATQSPNTLNTLHINNNSIVSPTGVTYNGTETIDMINNWWGHESGPTGGGHPGSGAALVGSGSTFLDVAPWVRTGVDQGGSALNGFQPNLVQAGHDAVSISGSNAVNEGSAYTITYTYNGDVDLAGVSTLIIDWGDGTSISTASTLAGSGTFTHTFADGPTTPTIQMFGVDGSRTYGMYPVKPVTVNNVAPSFTVSSAGPNNFIEGTNFTLTIGAVSDPGNENITMYRIIWGDGTQLDVPKASLASTSGKVIHLYNDDNPGGTSFDVNTISVAVQDEDSGATFHPVLPSQQLLVTVTNTAVAPTITGGTLSVNEGSTNAVTLGTGKAAGIVDQYTYSWAITKDTGGGPVSYTSSGVTPLTVTGTAIPTINFIPNDQGTYVVSFTLNDNDLSGPTSAAPRTYVAANVAPAPTIAPTATTTVNEGSTTTLTAVSGDPGSVDTFTYAWTITKNGGAYASGTNSTVVLIPNDNGAYGVTLTVTDNSGASGTTNRTITANNVAPTGTITGAPASIAEGSPVTLTASQTDPGSLDTFTYAWSVTKNAAAYSAGTGSPFVVTPNDNGTYVASLTVTDNNGGSNVKTATIIGTNVAPTASIAGTPTVAVNEGSTNVLTAAVTDPGSADTFTYAWSVAKNGTPGYATGTASTFNLVPNDNATYTVSLTVTDDDGGIATATAQTVTAVNVAPAPTIVGAAGTKPEATPITLTANPGDPGSADTFTYSWSVTKDSGGGPVSYAPSGTASTYSFTPNDNATYVVSLTVTDDDSGVGSTTSTINVVDVDPTVTITGASSLNEGQTYTATLGAVTDPAGANDTVTTYRIIWGDGTDTGFVAGSPANSTFTHRYDDGTFNRTITVELGDEDGFHTSGTKVIAVNNVNPTGTFFGPAGSVNLGDSSTVIWTTHSDPSNEDNGALRYDYDFNNDGVYEVIGSLSPSATVPASYLNTVGPHTIKSQIRDNDGGSFVQTAVINVVNASFRVVPGSFTPNNSGFSVQFNKSLVTSSLNLYDGDDAPSDAPDLIVTTSGGQPVRGSLVYDPTTNTATWVATGGALPNDSYSLTLVSGANAFTHGGGDDLDGDTSTGGLENYTQTFAVNSNTPVVSLPDFTRGTGQTVRMPSDLSAGLPVRISNPQGVTSVDFNLYYNPQMLNITAAALAAGVPSGWSITPVFTSISPTQTKLRITMSGGTQLSAGTSQMDIVSLTANVPSGTPYGDSQVLRLEDVVVNGNLSGVARGDYAIHKAAFVGDANRNGFYSGSDKSLIDRVVAGLDSGFDAYQLIDPVVIADVDSNGALQGQDSSWVIQKSLAPSSRPEIPNVTPVSVLGTGPDPTIDIPDNITVTAGGTIDVPLNITDSAAGLKGFNVTVNYDPTKMSLAGGFDSADVTLGALFTSANGWSINSFVDQSSGTVTIAFSRIVEMTGGIGTFANLHFAVSGAFTGASIITPSGAASDGGLSFAYQAGSVTTDVLQFRYNDPATPMSLVVTGNYVAGDLVLTNNTTSSNIPTGNITAVYASGTNVTTFRFPGYANGSLPDGNYHAVIGGTKNYDFFFLNGDANRDRIVDVKDLNILASNYNQSGRVFSQGDFNADGVVDAKDLGILSAHWQHSLPGAVGAQTASTGSAASSTRRTSTRAISLTDLQ